MNQQDNVSAARTCLIVLAVFAVLAFIACIILVIAISPLDLGSDDPTATADINAASSTSGAEDRLLVSVIDVGQGLSTLVLTPDGKSMLIDGGRSAERMEEQVVPYLRQLGIDELDYVVLTHPDQDHVGGLPRLLELMPVGTYVDPVIPNTNQRYEALLDLVLDSGIEPLMARRGMPLELGDGVEVELLWPEDPLLMDGDEVDKNDNSIVIRLTYGDVSFLFTGDAERGAERTLVELDQGNDLTADVLVVGHHGSNTSSTGEFLDAVDPEVAIIPVGLDNQYGHPHDEVVQRLRFRNIEIYRTDLDGTVEVWTDGEQIDVEALGTEATP